jgi:glyoxylase-like metal-dependent hydrolase (beta-lactamase superfamily II)
MLKQIAEGVLIRESEFIQSSSVVVQGRAGVLLIDPGVNGEELVALANDLRELGQPVVAGFSTHPHWDHVLWHADFGDAPRYGTAGCAASMRELLSNADWKARVAGVLPAEFAEEIPLDPLGLIAGRPYKLRRFHGMALESGLSSIRRMSRVMRRCSSRSAAFSNDRPAQNVSAQRPPCGPVLLRV